MTCLQRPAPRMAVQREQQLTDGMPTRIVTLRKRDDFLRVQRTGRQSKGRLMCLAASLAPGGETRVGYTVSRRVGNAVVRNRVRRRLREIVRLHRAALRPGRDLVVIAYPPAARATYCELEADFLRLVARLVDLG